MKKIIFFFMIFSFLIGCQSNNINEVNFSMNLTKNNFVDFIDFIDDGIIGNISSNDIEESKYIYKNMGIKNIKFNTSIFNDNEAFVDKINITINLNLYKNSILIKNVNNNDNVNKKIQDNIKASKNDLLKRYDLEDKDIKIDADYKKDKFYYNIVLSNEAIVKFNKNKKIKVSDIVGENKIVNEKGKLVKFDNKKLDKDTIEKINNIIIVKLIK